jgi:nitrite reductase/ring-hydroxylating ferredoxin subunit
MLLDVAAADELIEGIPRVVAANRRELVLVRWRGRVFALRNVCPHQSESFEQGRVIEEVTGGGRLGELELADDEPLLVCPWHSWQFRLRSGECVVDSRLRARTYRAVERRGRVLVELR